MTERRDKGTVDYDRLGEYLKALSVPSRLQLLRKLQVPHAVSEIELAPVRRDRELDPARSLSRQAVEGHLDTLEALGLVQARNAQRDGRTVTEYIVSHARLFLVVEELKRLSSIRSLADQATVAAASSPSPALELPPLPDGPALVIVGGPLEGSAFALEGAGPWIVGREKGNAITISYDPFLSKANTEIRREADGSFVVRTLPGARNGTRVNWRLLEAGESARLSAGDALGVGRSLLLVRGA